MEQQALKKEWQTPELIVLVRSRPEEAVLGACKALLPVTVQNQTNLPCATAGNGCKTQVTS